MTMHPRDITKVIQHKRAAGIPINNFTLYLDPITELKICGWASWKRFNSRRRKAVQRYFMTIKEFENEVEAYHTDVDVGYTQNGEYLTVYADEGGVDVLDEDNINHSFRNWEEFEKEPIFKGKRLEEVIDNIFFY